MRERERVVEGGDERERKRKHKKKSRKKCRNIFHLGLGKSFIKATKSFIRTHTHTHTHKIFTKIKIPALPMILIRKQKQN